MRFYCKDIVLLEYSYLFNNWLLCYRLHKLGNNSEIHGKSALWQTDGLMDGWKIVWNLLRLGPPDLMGKDSINPRSSQDDHGSCGFFAKIHHLALRISWQVNYYSCTSQIWPKWNSGKKEIREKRNVLTQVLFALFHKPFGGRGKMQKKLLQ